MAALAATTGNFRRANKGVQHLRAPHAYPIKGCGTGWSRSLWVGGELAGPGCGTCGPDAGSMQAGMRARYQWAPEGGRKLRRSSCAMARPFAVKRMFCRLLRRVLSGTIRTKPSPASPLRSWSASSWTYRDITYRWTSSAFAYSLAHRPSSMAIVRKVITNRSGTVSPRTFENDLSARRRPWASLLSLSDMDRALSIGLCSLGGPISGPP